ncbi:MAG: OmpA family protein [Kiritimatiellaeota bacterium]|nr:OmpA family protein [Kiritimatiellota bacterium]
MFKGVWRRCVCAGLAGAVWPALAQEGVDWTRWSVSPGAGILIVEGGGPTDGGAGASLCLGYDLSEHWTAEAGAAWMPYVKGAGNPHIYGASAEMLCHLSSYSRFDPYLALGAGYHGATARVFADGGAHGMAGPRAGFGVMYYLTEEVALRADARALMAVDRGCGMAYMATVGLALRLPERGAHGDGPALTDDERKRHGTDPFSKDTDGDGLTDYEEINIYGTDPLNPDSDFDGLTDYEEVKIYKTDPLKRDTDGGGVDDWHEIFVDGTDPLDPTDDLLMFDIPAEFDYNSAVLPPETVAALAEVIRELVASPHATALVEGHTDRGARADEKTAVALTERRARAVAAHLAQGGVAAERLSVKGYGFARPRVRPNLVVGNRENRRIEIYVRGVPNRYVRALNAKQAADEDN